MFYDPKKTINYFLYIFIFLSWVFTFLLSYDFDKLSFVLIAIFFVFVTVMEQKNIDGQVYLSRKTSSMKGFAISFFLLYVGQFFIYDVYFNKEAITILSLYATAVLISKFKDLISFDKLLTFYGLLFFTSSVLTIKDSPLAEFGYTYITGAEGILSSFILFTVYLSLSFSKFRFSSYISYITAALICVFQIRVIVLSLLLSILTRKGVGRKTFISIIICLCFTLLLYLIFPDSRIFQTQTSGRVIHWEVIFHNAELTFTSLIFGMGNGFSTEVLILHGVGEFMAAPHNEYIRYILDLGFLGFTLLVFTFKLIYEKSENKFLIFVLLIQMCTDNVFTYFHNYLFIIILLIFYPARR